MTTLSSDSGPFGIVPIWLLSAAEPRSVVLFALLAQKANDDNASWPSRSWVAKRLGWSVKTVDRAVADLVEAGALLVEHRRDKAGDPTSNRYVVLFAKPEGFSEGQGSPSDGGTPMEGGTPAEGSTGGVTGGGTGSVTADALSIPRLNKTKELDQVALAPQSRPADPVFELLFFIDAGLPYTTENAQGLTKTARGALNRAAGEVRETGVGIEDLRAAITAWPEVMDDATCTANAIAKHLPRLLAASRGVVARGRAPSDQDRLLDDLRKRRELQERKDAEEAAMQAAYKDLGRSV